MISGNPAQHYLDKSTANPEPPAKRIEGSSQEMDAGRDHLGGVTEFVRNGRWGNSRSRGGEVGHVPLGTGQSASNDA